VICERLAFSQNVVNSGVESLAFKELRNLGYLDKLTDYIKSVEEKNLDCQSKITIFLGFLFTLRQNDGINLN
jgi:hypothetical protein